MRTSWTFMLVAGALVVSAFPAFAKQGGAAPPQRTQEQIKRDRKIDAAAMTPFVTKHQADTLKKAANKGDERKADEQIAYPQDGGPFESKEQSLPGATITPNAPGAPVAPGDPNAPAPKEEPKPEPRKTVYRLMGTVCSTGPSLAMFDKGGEWPAMLHVGDQVEPGITISEISRGKVKLQQDVPAMRPGEKAHKEFIDVYAW